MSYNRDKYIFSKDKYNKYYSLKKLINDMEKKNIDFHKLNLLELNDLFILGIKNGLVDLVEYLYVFDGYEYELGELIEFTNVNISTNQYSNTLMNVIVYDQGANSGLKLQYLDKSNQQMQKSINKLIDLKKFSKYRSKKKKYYYKFNSKYINKIINNEI